MSVWPEVQSEAAGFPGIEVLAPHRCASLAAQFADAFVADRAMRWWWAALRADVPTTSVAYGDADAWALVLQWLPEERSLVLLVTDEEAVPAGGVKGATADLAELVAGCPYFEYVVTDDAASFGIFDTHHNELIRVGPLPD